MPKKLSEELQKSLVEILKDCELEDKELREGLLRQWSKNEHFWHGLQHLFWSDNDNCWRSPVDFQFGGLDKEEENQLGSFSDRVIDIFRGHGEAIIAALAAQIPAIRFMPDDADSPADLLTARTYSKIAELVQRHNKAKLIFLRALYFLALQGLVASYRYKESDYEYGSYKVPKFGTADKEVTTYVCPNCDNESETNWQVDAAASNEDPTNQNIEQPTDPSINPQQQSIETAPNPCPVCGQLDPPIVNTEVKPVPINLGDEEIPKSRAKVDIFGPSHFKVSHYARNQSETSYLILYGDLSKDTVKEAFPDFIDEIDAATLDTSDRINRTGYGFNSAPDNQNYLVTVKKAWFRPAAFYREKEEGKRKQLLKLYPKGVRLTVVGKNNIFIDSAEEKLDDRWTIGQAGLSTFIHSDPILRPLIQIQEMRNDLVNLIMETIKHGIPSMFADPEVVNFDIYGRFEAVPGYIYKIKPTAPGQPLASSFYTSDRATLSREVAMFLQQLDKDAQFCIGSFPSIYGGPSEGKSRTFSEYAASRQMALQRLSIVWNFLTDWWITTIHGCVKMYVECIVEDEKFTKFESGNYVNVWIKQSELAGKVGAVEPESAEGFPITQAQKKDLIMKLMELNNEYINSVLFYPENAHAIQDAFALTELKVPGESQRVKQVIEIYELLKAGDQELEPVPGDPNPATGKPSFIPFVEIDPLVDDDAVHIATIKSWAVDVFAGMDAKKNNPIGYAQVMAHLELHEQSLAQKTMSMAGGTPPGEQPETAKSGAEA